MDWIYTVVLSPENDLLLDLLNQTPSAFPLREEPLLGSFALSFLRDDGFANVWQYPPSHFGSYVKMLPAALQVHPYHLGGALFLWAFTSLFPKKPLNDLASPFQIRNQQLLFMLNFSLQLPCSSCTDFSSSASLFPILGQIRSNWGGGCLLWALDPNTYSIYQAGPMGLQYLHLPPNGLAISQVSSSVLVTTQLHFKTIIELLLPFSHSSYRFTLAEQ